MDMANVNPQGVDLSTGKNRLFKTADTLTDDQGNPLLTQGATGISIQGATGLLGATGIQGITGIGAGGDTLFIPMSVSNGQTLFTLSPAPINTTSVLMLINGGAYFAPTYFTVSGANVTWLNAFMLQSTDAVSFRYT